MPGLAGVATKTPTEVVAYTLDWTSHLAQYQQALAIVGLTVTVTDRDGTDVTPSLVQGPPTAYGLFTVAYFQNGVKGEVYTAIYQITTSDNQVLESGLRLILC